MMLSRNILTKTFQREIEDRGHASFQRRFQVTSDFVSRLGLEAELEGHQGCVNCLEWNESGTLLASGSDDVQVMIWDPLRHKSLTTIRTGHQGNIFSVKFLPNSSDSIIVSGAADCKIRVHDLNVKETTHVFSCHAGRVKRIATAPNVPFMFWSAAEDGTIMQFDLRTPELSANYPQNVLINLNAHMGPHAEAKCVALNPIRPEQLAVGANDPYVRLYDRRMLSCKSIKFPNDNGFRSPWERQNLLANFMSAEDYALPQGCAQYLIAGHSAGKFFNDAQTLGAFLLAVRLLQTIKLKAISQSCISDGCHVFLTEDDSHLPQKQQEYRKKYRTLASTFLTFGPDGSELLVNLGGEQIYMFDVNKPQRPQRFDKSLCLAANGLVKEACASTNGFSLHRNGTTANGVTNGVTKHAVLPSSSALSARMESEASNRSAKRHRPDSGPLSSAVEKIKKAANSCFENEQYHRAIILYNQAVAMASDSPVLYGNRAAAFMKRRWDGDLYAALRDCHTAIKIDPNHLKAHFRLARCLYELSWTKEAYECLQQFKDKFPDYARSHACEALDRDIKAAIFSQTDSPLPEESEPPSPSEKGDTSPSKKPVVKISDQEKIWRSEACDYAQRFCGHCNTTTDIKEANFFGSNGQYIVAGSDDGSFFIWEKKTTNIVRVLRGDDSIVNCLQSHPTNCLLATSGIDPVVRLWSPRAEDGSKNDREVDNSDDAAVANQKRMNADPLEVMLMNMGYRITGVLDVDEDDPDRSDHTVQCRPS